MAFEAKKNFIWNGYLKFERKNYYNLGKCICTLEEYDTWYECTNINTGDRIPFVVSDLARQGGSPGGINKITYSHDLSFNGFKLPLSISGEDFKIGLENFFEWK